MPFSVKVMKKLHRCARSELVQSAQSPQLSRRDREWILRTHSPDSFAAIEVVEEVKL
jgi:hypothetical protein